jgi:hypothetical protein
MSARTFMRWAGGAIATPKDPDQNQDRAAIVHLGPERVGEGVDCGVVVCDGVGALSGSGLVAEQAATTAADYIAAHGVRTAIVGGDDPLGAGGDVLHCAQHVADVIGPVDDGATTLIAVAADELGYVAYSFVGNGTLLDVEPLDRGAYGFRLSAAELVTPHVTWKEGRPALRSVIPPRAGSAVAAARGVLFPQPDRTRLLLAVTDGIASDEERSEGISAGARWRKVPAPLAAVMAALEAQWPDVVDDADPGGRLETLLEDVLVRLAEDVLVDDATVGAVLVVPRDEAEEGRG